MEELSTKELLGKIEALEKENSTLKSRLLQQEDEATFLQTLLNSIVMPVFYKDVQGIYKDCNPAFAEKILGLKVDEVKGKSLFDLPSQIPADLAKTYHQKDLELMKKEGTQIYENAVKRSDGTLGEYVFYKSPTYDKTGTLSGIIGVMLDITIRKNMETDLKESHQRLQTLMDATHVGIVIHDDGIILDANNGLSDMIGYSHEDLVGKNVLEFFPPQNHKIIAEAVKSQGNTDFKSECYTKKGDLLPIAISGRQFPYQGKSVRVVELINLSERESLLNKLNETKDDVERLEGLLPICAHCKKIRNDSGYWEQIETYIRSRSDAEFTHGLCPRCAEELYGDKKWFKKKS